MRPIFIPDLARALRADWAPGPGVFVLKYIEQPLTISKSKPIYIYLKFKDFIFHNDPKSFTEQSMLYI